ncbi:hypothetical protein NBO_59g0012 [Nosema bombycis CQ1]|uniref:Uncharacterized protein n=1 Tax=Nosema bombycis (strain CQ1 / CVCC 102059) TaxID=578461 RepID=R0MI12_NOSB1|nr:hypothetical protein NBO_59g0012 [Nosema bombycis CQ1]|eukprot:EOB13790.1 hypothetical protein NBO_59g0012 [Nosema bombycis CQ1]
MKLSQLNKKEGQINKTYIAPMNDKREEKIPDLNQEDKQELPSSGIHAGLVTPKKPNRYNPKLFSSPASKARILTPIKTALHNSNRNTSKFIKKIQEIMDNKNKEKVEDERNL